MSDNFGFTSLGAKYFPISINIIEVYSQMQLNYLEMVHFLYFYLLLLVFTFNLPMILDLQKSGNVTTDSFCLTLNSFSTSVNILQNDSKLSKLQ